MEFHIEVKTFAYDVIRMEENENSEDFWYCCARFSQSINDFFHNQKKNDMEISDICVFLKKHYSQFYLTIYIVR